jgi:hypothetical protein
MDAHTETKYHVHGQAQPDDAGKLGAMKVARPVCAVRRVVRSLPEAGGMREEIPGLLAYLEAKAEGDQACQESGAYSKAL